MGKENGGGRVGHQLASSHSEKIGISVMDDDVGIVFKVAHYYLSSIQDLWMYYLGMLLKHI